MTRSPADLHDTRFDAAWELLSRGLARMAGLRHPATSDDAEPPATERTPASAADEPDDAPVNPLRHWRWE